MPYARVLGLRCWYLLGSQRVLPMTIAEFLLARIAEDEAVAIAAVRGFTEGDFWRAGNTTALASAQHVASHGPARVLAECEAKRRIVELHAIAPEVVYHCHCDGKQCPPSPRMCDTCASTTLPMGADGTMPCETLAALAVPYADHEDYREEWRP